MSNEVDADLKTAIQNNNSQGTRLEFLLIQMIRLQKEIVVRLDRLIATSTSAPPGITTEIK